MFFLSKERQFFEIFFKIPSLARSVPKPLKVPSLARSVPKPLKVPNLAHSVPKPLLIVPRCRPPTPYFEGAKRLVVGREEFSKLIVGSEVRVPTPQS